MGNRTPYKTKQSRLVMAYLERLGEDAHTTIPQIEAHFSQAGTPVSTATLYRQLEKLVAQGCVRRFQLADRAGACYQYLPAHQGCNAHFHLKCEHCGSLVHLDCAETRSFQQHVLESHGFSANYSKTVIYGVCRQCAMHETEPGGTP